MAKEISEAAEPLVWSAKDIMEREDRHMGRVGRLLTQQQLHDPSVGEVRIVIADYSSKYEGLWLPQIRLMAVHEGRQIASVILDTQAAPQPPKEESNA